jgi:hypothetical protein
MVQRLYYNDVAEIAEFIGVNPEQLWNKPEKFFDPLDRENKPFTFDMLVLRWMCQSLPTELVRKAVGR